MKGQEEAPFEILIGVIIFAFVMSIATYLWSTSCEEQLKTKLQAELTNFARNIEAVYKGGIYTTERIQLDFSVLGCSRYNLDRIVIYEGSQKECLTHTGMLSCYVIGARVKDRYGESMSIIREYLSVPTNVRIEVGGNSCGGGYSNTQCEFKFREYAVSITKESKDSIKIEIL